MKVLLILKDVILNSVKPFRELSKGDKTFLLVYFAGKILKEKLTLLAYYPQLAMLACSCFHSISFSSCHYSCSAGG